MFIEIISENVSPQYGQGHGCEARWAPFCVLMSLKRRVRAARVCIAQQNLLVRVNYVIFVFNYLTSPFLT